MDVFEILQERGFIKQTTGDAAVRELLNSGSSTFYAGFDPTANSMHVGNLLPIMAMAWLQRAGHRALALVGGGTAMVGDPSGKTETRQLLDVATIDANKAAIQGQLEHFLVLDGAQGEVVDNATWLTGLGYIAFLRDVGRHFSVNRMLAAEAYKARLERGLSFIEFNYQILQAYDFLTLYRTHRCVLQLGGDDQWGNILAGTDLVRRLEEAEVHALTIPLLTTASGAKMGKTHKGSVWLDRERFSPFDYYQYWISCDDRDVGKLLRLYTFLPMERVRELEALEGSDLREAKRVLAFEATSLAHGEQAAQEAEAGAAAMVAGAATADMPSHEVAAAALSEGLRLYVAMADAGLVKSRGEGRRLIAGGGCKLNGEKVIDPERDLVEADFATGDAVVRLGKKRAVRLTLGG
ncbi:MAG: tyrosine--tRNA ligase [Deltaproteobacteria bacterium]|nr:tyrosine--tRNA ligase [Deltaproteobacteria bacterium]